MVHFLIGKGESLKNFLGSLPSSPSSLCALTYCTTVIFEKYIMKMWGLGDIFNDRWTFVKLCPQKNDFSGPDGDRTRLPLMSHISRTCTLAYHLSLGSSMIRASHRSSEGCGFDPRIELRNRFSEDRAWRTFIYQKLLPLHFISEYRLHVVQW